jgi:hypothetical protein
MLEKGICTAALVFFLFAAQAQVVPKFEVASVRVSTLTGGEGSTSETVRFTPHTFDAEGHSSFLHSMGL